MLCTIAIVLKRHFTFQLSLYLRRVLYSICMRNHWHSHIHPHRTICHIPCILHIKVIELCIIINKHPLIKCQNVRRVHQCTHTHPHTHMIFIARRYLYGVGVHVSFCLTCEENDCRQVHVFVVCEAWLVAFTWICNAYWRGIMKRYRQKTLNNLSPLFHN